METSTPPPQTIDLSPYLYQQLVYTLTDLLPPPFDDSPEALSARNHAAIAKVAALLPVNANEADLAPSFACSFAQCIAARGQAEDILRLLRQNANDIGLVVRLNAQYGSMVRTSLSVHGRLTRIQALRQKREAIDAAANADAWAQHIAERSMLVVVDPDAAPREAALPGRAPAKLPGRAPAKLPGRAPAKSPGRAPAKLPGRAPAADGNQRIAGHVSEDGINSHDAAFEMWLSATLPSRASGPPDGSHLHEVALEAIAEPRSAGREVPANGR